MKKKLSFILSFLLVATISYANGKDQLSVNMADPKAETNTSSVIAEEDSESVKLNLAIEEQIDSKEMLLFDYCYAGMTSCNIGYMFCQQTPMTGAQQLIVWDYYDGLLCG